MSDHGQSAFIDQQVRRVPRTIADTDGCERINENHISEAIQYRLLDRSF